MKVKVLADDAFQIVGFVDGTECVAETFILEGEATTAATRKGLLDMIKHVASKGFQGSPSAWFHEANKEGDIYEFTKGSLRLFFFKGQGRQIAICTSGVRKSGAKADKPSVKNAVKIKDEYWTAIANNTCEVIEIET